MPFTTQSTRATINARMVGAEGFGFAGSSQPAWGRGAPASKPPRPPPCVTPNQRLLEVLPVVLASDIRNVPVVNTLKENRLVGALSRSEVLNIFSEVIAASGKGEE